MVSSKNKVKSLLMTLSVCGFSNAQVAINNTNPQGTFHVDGGKDNPATGVPTTAQQANDFVVKADGKVGIGTTTPQTKLDLVTAANAVGLQHTDGNIRLQTFLGRGTTNGNTDAGWLGTYTNHPLDFMTSNAFRVRITPEGNVGIGTSTPAVKLEINNGSTNGAIKIVDGTQGSGKVLTSDANGVGTWSPTPVTALYFVSSSPYTGNTDFSGTSSPVGGTVGNYRFLATGNVNNLGPSTTITSGTEGLSYRIPITGLYRLTLYVDKIPTSMTIGTAASRNGTSLTYNNDRGNGSSGVMICIWSLQTGDIVYPYSGTAVPSGDQMNETTFTVERVS